MFYEPDPKQMGKQVHLLLLERGIILTSLGKKKNIYPLSTDLGK